MEAPSDPQEPAAEERAAAASVESDGAANPPPPAKAVRVLALIAWVLPVVLGLVAVFIELEEHIASGEDDISVAFLGEVAFFALAGPLAVAVTLRWVARLVNGYRATAAALEGANRSLEAKVADRTRHLEQATASLAEANADLRRLDAMKTEFVSLVSHQLRAPLTNINGALEIVAQDAELLPPSGRRTLQILGLESQRLSRLIESILDVSRIEAGRLTVNLGLVAVEPILARAAASVLAASLKGRLAIRVEAGLPPAWADEMLVEEVVRNLVENAVRYAPGDSPIELAAGVIDGQIRIAVVDHGPGVPAEDQKQIFRSFHRLDDAESAPNGYGLGLYFAEKLLRAQSGAIWVESPVWPDPDGPGARFVVSLPVAPDDPESSGEESA